MESIELRWTDPTPLRLGSTAMPMIAPWWQAGMELQDPPNDATEGETFSIVKYIKVWRSINVEFALSVYLFYKVAYVYIPSRRRPMCIARDLRVAGALSRFFSLRALFPLELFSGFSISPPTTSHSR
jgi:hypothetical protein